MGLYTVVWGKSKDPIDSTTAPLKDEESSGAHELPITATAAVSITPNTTITRTSEMSNVTTSQIP